MRGVHLLLSPLVVVRVSLSGPRPASGPKARRGEGYDTQAKNKNGHMLHEFLRTPMGQASE